MFMFIDLVLALTAQSEDCFVQAPVGI